MTNGDKIRKMMDEELAEFIVHFDYGEVCNDSCPKSDDEKEDCMNFCDCFEEVVKIWLKQEVKEDA